jgi:PAS domain S-box-containing protein
MDPLRKEAQSIGYRPCAKKGRPVKDELRQAIDTIPGFVWSALPNGDVDFLNQRWCDFTGVSLLDATGEGWLTAIHPEDRPRLVDLWNSLLNAREPGEFEARLRRSDGTFRWFLIRAVPLFDDGGRLVKWYGQNTDIEDRKQAEHLLTGEKRLLEMVALGYELPNVLHALCAFVNEVSVGCHCSILLIEPAGDTVRHAAAPSLPPDFSRAIDGHSTSVPYWGPCAMAIDQKTPVIVSDISQDARWHNCEWCTLALAAGLRSCWSTPILSQAGNPLGTFALYQHDVGIPTPLHTELIEQFTHIASIAIERAHAEAMLKHAHGELRQSETFLAEAQRLSLTGSFVWRVAKAEIIWSEQTYRIYQIDPGLPLTFDLVGTRIHPEEASWFQDVLVRASNEGRDLEFEHRLQMPDLSTKYLHVVARATRDDDGQLEYIGAVQDVTDRRRSEDALNRLRSDLAHMGRVTTLGALTASIAHEVNQPLSGIITNASTSLLMLADNPADIDGAREAAERTIRDANRASEVIARLRALFKKTSTASDSFDLNEATREVLALSVSELQRAQVVVRAELADDLQPVRGDRVQLQQVILNLILNAAEAMSAVEDRPRQLVVRTERDEGDHVRLTVRDTGPGVDPHTMPRLFEAFHTTKRDGMGIGLSISRSIIDRHQGRLWGEAHDGPGASFAFSIPRLPVLDRVRNVDDPPSLAVPHRDGVRGHA